MVISSAFWARQVLQHADRLAAACIKSVVCKDVLTAIQSISKNVTDAVAQKLKALQDEAEQLIRGSLDKCVTASKSESMAKFVAACEKTYSEGLQKSDVWELACTTGANEFYAAHRFFEKTLTLKKDFKASLNIDLADCASGGEVGAVGKLLASLTMVQAMYRPLKPDETRQGLLIKCNSGMLSKDMVGHGCAAHAFQKMVAM